MHCGRTEHALRLRRGWPANPVLQRRAKRRQGGIDFQNSVLTTENKATVLLRHAYAEVKDDDFRFLVGQTWDVISPLTPGMLMSLGIVAEAA